MGTLRKISPNLEESLLARLKQANGRIISYRDLYIMVWGSLPRTGYLNTLRATVSRARLLLDSGSDPDSDPGSVVLCNVRGIGYMLQQEDEW